MNSALTAILAALTSYQIEHWRERAPKPRPAKARLGLFFLDRKWNI